MIIYVLCSCIVRILNYIYITYYTNTKFAKPISKLLALIPLSISK